MARPLASESRIPVGNTSLYARVVGEGRPVMVLHGGPDFDHTYFLPELDGLAETVRLIYYDQRGRGRSAKGVKPETVTLASDLEDIDRVRRHFGLASSVLLGHSWGAVLAMEYALRHPTCVSRLVLMNPAPASASDAAVTQAALRETLGDELARQREIVASLRYQQGDPETVTARYRIHFRSALRRPEQYEALMARIGAAFRTQGSEGILIAHAVERRLFRDTYEAPGYDLLPALRRLQTPTLVVTGDHDFVPVEMAAHIAEAIPNACLVTIRDCGHFAYLECPAELRSALEAFWGQHGLLAQDTRPAW